MSITRDSLMVAVDTLHADLHPLQFFVMTGHLCLDKALHAGVDLRGAHLGPPPLF